MPLPRSIPALLAVALLAGAARGQPATDEEGPLVLTRHPSWEWFRLGHFGGHVELEGRYQLDRQRSASAPGITDRESLLRETLGLEGDGYVGSPEFLKLDAAAGLSFTQSRLDSESIDRTGSEAEWENLYNFRARFLENSAAPFTLYSLRERSLVDRLFAGTLESTMVEHGASVQFRSRVMPTGLHYFHREQEQQDRFGDLDYGLRQDTFQVDSDLIISEAQRLETDYTFDDIHEDLAQGVSTAFQRHDLTLTHTLDLGESGRSSLRSTGRYFNQLGDNEQERARLDESLRLAHTDRFETRYDGSIERFTQGGERQDLLQASAGARYRLFESLTVSGDVGGSRLDAAGDSTTLFLDAALRYVKLVPYGRVDSSLGVAMARQHDGARGDPRAVNNELHAFNDPQPIVIIRRNILPESIRVSDAADIRVFLRGLDYTVQAFPDRVELRRVLGGAIADGEAVLVDYTVGPEPESTVDTGTLSATIRYTIDEGTLAGVSVYANYRNTDQRQVDGIPQEFLLNDARVIILGTEYRKGPVTLSAEHENHDSDVLPFTALRLSARYDQAFGRASGLAAGVTHETISYRDPENHVRLDRVFGTWTQELGQNLDLEVRGVYRDEHDDVIGDLRGFDQGLELRWHQRQTEITGSIRNSIIDSEQGDSMFQSIWLTLRRNF